MTDVPESASTAADRRLAAFTARFEGESEGPTADVETVEVPVLVVGAGAAGASVAIELAERGIEPLVIGKRDHGDAHTTWAAGGINAALGTHDPEDDWRAHAADTYEEGHFINDPVAVERVCEAMPDRIRRLEEWGMPFDRTDDGEVDQRYFGAQTNRRTCFVGDRTGEAILETLVERAQELEISYRENVMITRVLSDGSRSYGAVGFDMESGELLRFRTDHVVLAAGGFAGVYDRHSSREDENNGDGPALALDAGARLIDPEFVQFHPTGMVGDRYGEEWDGRLVTEAVRGEGGRLYNADDERFMEEYSPERLELDARDVVARAIAREVREGREGRGTDAGGVYLDISHEDPDDVRERLPKMVERFEDLGVDITEEPMEVAPTAHYTMGGADIDFRTGETGVEGLYAVGETVAGVHGANRLGGNSLAETVAIGPLVGEHVAARVTGEGPDGPLPADVEALAATELSVLESIAGSDGDEDPRELLDELGELLQSNAGILREEEALEEGLAELDSIRERAASIAVGDRTHRSFEFALDLSVGLPLAEALLRGAIERTESRGAHYRTDHTDQEEAWRANLTVVARTDGLELHRRGVGDPSDAVREAIEDREGLDYHHLE